MALEDLNRYRPAAVAAKFYQEKNETAAKGALEELVDTLDVGKDGPALLKAIRKSDDGNKMLANIYAPNYQEILMNAKIKELFKFYSNYFEEYIEGDSYREAVRVFNEYGNENYKDVFSEVIRAQETLDSEAPNITEEEKQEAQDTLTKYQRITNSIQGFEQLEMEKLSNPIAKGALKKDLTEMFKPQKEA